MNKKLNKITGYYEGPDGVFYNFKHDEIFILEFYGRRAWRENVGEVGRCYRYLGKGYMDRKDNVIIDGAKWVIRLGEL